MTIPDSVSQGLSWFLVVGLAFYSADAASAVLENRLRVPPKPLPATAQVSIQQDQPAQAPAPGLIALMGTTKPAEAESASGEASGSSNGARKNPNGNQKQPEVKPTNLRLKGTMAGFGGAGLAMLESQNEMLVISAGEEVAGYRLVSVEPYSVTLEANGQYQVLEMDVARDLTPPPPPASTAQSVEEPVVPAPEEEADEAQEAEEGEPASILTQRELRNILDNPTEFAGQGFRMNPVLREGEIIGMQVALPDTSHPLARLGLKHGDIVRTLNGQELNGPEALTSIYRVLRNTSSLRFEVERDGQNQSIDIALSE